MHKRRLRKCVILIPERIYGNHRVIRSTILSKNGRKSIEDRVAGIRNSSCAKLRYHNPLGRAILSQCFRVHEAILVGDASIPNGKSVQQGGAVEQMAEGHVAHLPAAGSIAQQTTAYPFGNVPAVMALNGINYLPLAGSQPHIRRAVGIQSSVAIQSFRLRIISLLIVFHL